MTRLRSDIGLVKPSAGLKGTPSRDPEFFVGVLLWSRKLLVSLLVGLWMSFWGTQSVARVFNFNKENVAFYFGASYGPSALKQSHFEGTSGTGVTIADSVSINQSGELGLLFKRQGLSFKLGAEVIAPASIKDAKGINASSTQIHTMGSYISALIPKVGAEFDLSAGNWWRVFFSGGYGAGTGSLSNSYTLTAAGQTAYPSLTNFTDEASGSFPFYEGGLGGEVLFSDTTTLSLSIGYRSLKITKFKYKEAVTNFNGSHIAGSTVLDDQSLPVASDFSGATAMLQFRFYLK